MFNTEKCDKHSNHYLKSPTNQFWTNLIFWLELLNVFVNFSKFHLLIVKPIDILLWDILFLQNLKQLFSHQIIFLLHPFAVYFDFSPFITRFNSLKTWFDRQDNIRSQHFELHVSGNSFFLNDRVNIHNSHIHKRHTLVKICT